MSEIFPLHPSDTLALETILAVRPTLHDHKRASDHLMIDRNVILHAGPAFSSKKDITTPVLNSASAAVVFEGLVNDFVTAKKMVESGEIRLVPAQDYNVVVPLAGVVSASMWLHEVFDSADMNNRTYAPLNGGSGPAMRLGLCNSEVVSHWRWLNGEFFEAISSSHSGDIDLLSIATHALSKGDDCHGRTVAGTQMLIDQWCPEIEKYPAAIEFLRNSPMFFLNLWMAACKCMLMSAAGINHSSMITSAGANGHELGIQIAGLPNKWFTAKAAPLVGDLGEFSANRALGAIGDSAIVDAAGFGAMAIALAPEQMKALSKYLPKDALLMPQRLLAGIHSAFGNIDFRTGLCARTVTASKSTPIIGLGILDKEGIAGRLGGGIARYPIEVFEESLASLD